MPPLANGTLEDDPHAAPDEPFASTEGPLETACAWLCCVALLVLMVMTSAEVAARGIFGHSFEFADEVGGYLLVFITFVSLPVCQVRHSFHSIALVQGRLSPRGRALSSLVFTLISIIFVATMSWELSVFELGVWRSGDLAATKIATPMWLPQLAMPLGMIVLLYSLLKRALLEIRTLRTADALADAGEDRPHAA